MKAVEMPTRVEAVSQQEVDFKKADHVGNCTMLLHQMEYS